MRPSKIDKLDPAIRDQIGLLRGQGRSIDEILAKLAELLPQDEQPSRSGLHRHIQRVEAMGAKMRMVNAASDHLIGRLGDAGENKVVRLLIGQLETMLFEMLCAQAEGEALVVEAKDVKAISAAVRDIAMAVKLDADTTLRLRERKLVELEAVPDKAADQTKLLPTPEQALEDVRKIYRGEG